MNFWYLPIALLIVGLVYSYWFGHTPALIGFVYLLASAISYYLYSKDKRAAKNGIRRVPENTLHFWAILGGWPGSIIGQQKLRHKTKKMSFRIVFYITIAINVGLISWLHTPHGSAKLHSYIYNMEYWVANRWGGNITVTALLKLTKFHHVL